MKREKKATHRKPGKGGRRAQQQSCVPSTPPHLPTPFFPLLSLFFLVSYSRPPTLIPRSSQDIPRRQRACSTRNERMATAAAARRRAKRAEGERKQRREGKRGTRGRGARRTQRLAARTLARVCGGSGDKGREGRGRPGRGLREHDGREKESGLTAGPGLAFVGDMCRGAAERGEEETRREERKERLRCQSKEKGKSEKQPWTKKLGKRKKRWGEKKGKGGGLAPWWNGEKKAVSYGDV